MHINNPLISVVMPAYNAEEFIGQAIDSILGQTYKNIELLIADDASKDKTKKIIESYNDERIKTFHNNVNMGYLKTCNKLFEKAQGDYIAFQDADDFSVSNRFEEQLKAFNSDTDLGVVGCNLTAIDTKNNVLFSSNYFLEHDNILNLMPDDFSIIPNSFMFKTEIYQRIGGYHDFWDRIGAEDYYWTYLIMEKYKLINLKTPLYFYRFNPNSITGDHSDNEKKMFTRNILNFLLNQRKEYGFDYLETKDQKLNDYIAALEAPYKADKSLFFRQMAAKYFHEGLKSRGLKLIIKAIKKNPIKIQNYRDYVYMLKKSII